MELRPIAIFFHVVEMLMVMGIPIKKDHIKVDRLPLLPCIYSLLGKILGEVFLGCYILWLLSLFAWQ